MAHKTLINGTAYEITGGKALREGASYSVKNGKVLVGGAEYDNSFLLSPAILELWSNEYTAQITCVAYGNGYWVVGGVYQKDRDYSARIAYATSPEGPWTIKDIWTGYNNCSINSIIYAGGYWAVCGAYNTTTGIDSARFAYATSPDGTWTNTDLHTASGSTATCIAYANNCWVVGVNYYSGSQQRYYACFYYTYNISSNWTQTGLWNSYGSYTGINCIAYGNGYWVVGGAISDSGQYGSAVIAYATDIKGAWQTYTLWDGISYSRITCITYANGYFVACGVSSSRTTSYTARIAYATSPNQSWTTKVLWTGRDNSSDKRIYSVTYADGHWVVCGMYYSDQPADAETYYARIAYFENLEDTATIINLWSGYYGDGNGPATCIAYGNGCWVVGGVRAFDTMRNAIIAYSPTLEGFNDL